MADTHASPLTAPSPHKSPLGRVARCSPRVQELQSAAPYIDIYTGSPLGHFSNPETPTAFASQPHSQFASQAHPDPLPRWRGPRGFGTQHINDHFPFSLWSEDKQDFRHATSQEMNYIADTYNAERLEFHDYLIVIETSTPPTPVPLTVAGMPAIFVPPHQKRKFLCGSAPYVNPRIPDPCPDLGWKRMSTPAKSQMANVITVLIELMNVRRVNFLPTSIVVELFHDDGRTYQSKSLPAVVAGLSTSYHHDPVPFFSSINDRTRERLLDPAQYLPGPRIGPLPQDTTNYLQEPSWGILCPGVRVSTNYATGSGTYADAVQSTTCGIRLRKGVSEYISVANHGFLAGDEVFHPDPEGDKIGDVVDRYPELDVAMVQLTPAHSGRFHNHTYFQAETPRRLVGTSDLVRGAWFEVDGMSTGLISCQFMIESWEHPIRSPGHPKIPVLEWHRDIVFRMFGAANTELMDGLCGAPFVEAQTGNVAGFFHSADGDWAKCAALDDLVAEGWEVA